MKEIKFTKEDMEKAFEAGSDWMSWSERASGLEEAPPYFDEWLKENYNEEDEGN